MHMVFLTVSKSRPEIIIRKKLPMPLPIECYVEAKVLSRAFVSLFKLVIHGRGSMIIAGPPGSGKTTLLRSILYYLVYKLMLEGGLRLSHTLLLVESFSPEDLVQVWI